jgi:hypothetical protein
LSNETGEDHVNVVLDTESEVVLVLFAEGWEIDVCFGKVNALARGDLAGIQGTAFDVLDIDNFEDCEGEDAIIDVDDTTWGDHLGDVLVVNVPEWSSVCE